MILTLPRGEEWTEVRLMKDGQVIKSWNPADGDSLHDSGTHPRPPRPE
jgi:hypothetical protein